MIRGIDYRAWINSSQSFKKIQFIGLGEEVFPVYTADMKYWFPMQGVLEQFTGLRDKNGTKIYDGDIIKIRDTSYGEQNDHYGVVRYSEYAELVIGNISLSRVYQATEVIGNIHENADLLEK